MQYGSYVVFIGVLIQITAVYPHGATEQFIIGRVVTGLGTGINTSTIPSWLGECSKPKNRGFLICVECAMIAIGTAIAVSSNLSIRGGFMGGLELI
jgi:MFS family permease